MVILSQSVITAIGHSNFQSIPEFANQDGGREGSHGKNISKYAYTNYNNYGMGRIEWKDTLHKEYFILIIEIVGKIIFLFMS